MSNSDAKANELFSVDRPELTHNITPFSGDALLRWVVSGKVWTRLLLGPILLMVLAAGSAMDGHLYEISAGVVDSPEIQRLAFVDEAFGLFFTLFILTGIILFIRSFNREIPKVLSALFQNRILLVDDRERRLRLETATRRLNHPIYFLGSALFSAWLVSMISAARFAGLESQLGFVTPYTVENGNGAFLAGCVVIVISGHLFISTLWRIAVSGHFIYESFMDRSRVRLQPAHGDRCCGVRFLGSFTLFTSSYLLLFPVFVGGVVLIHPEIYELDAFRYSFVYFGMANYAVTAAVLFLGPTLSVHRVMESSREESLQFLNDRFLNIYDEVFERLQQREIDAAKLEEEVGILNNIKSVVSEVQTRNIWPFNMKLTLEFAGIVFLPLLPMVFEAVM